MVQSYASLSSIHQDKLAELVGGKFKLTRLISQRLRDINNGAPILVERNQNEALLVTVCREIEEGLISLETQHQTGEDYQEEGSFEDFLGLGEDLG